MNQGIRVVVVLGVALAALGAGLAGQARSTGLPDSITTRLASSVPSSIDLADSLVALPDLEGAWRVLQVRLEVAPDDREAAWRAVRVGLGLGILGVDHPTRLRWLRAADEVGRHIEAMGPGDIDALAWVAAARGRLAQSESGGRTVARLAGDTWRLTDRVLTEAPDHPLANNVLGMLHQETMRLSGFERFVARHVLGLDPAGLASWRESEDHLAKAVSLDPGMVLFHVDLGDTYRFQDKLGPAEAAYRRGLAVPSRLPVDDHLKELLRARLVAMGVEPSSR